jgi:hypothetical protein
MSPDKTEIWVAIVLFILSELVGMSNLKANSLVQLAFTLLYRVFPGQLKVKKPRSSK